VSNRPAASISLCLPFLKQDDCLTTPASSGSYQLVVHGNRVHDAAGHFLNGGMDQVNPFFRLFCDARGTGTVDDADLALFQTTFNKHLGDPGYLWYFDYNGDGVVDQTDYDQFLLRYGR
jgi:hypothetical protein